MIQSLIGKKTDQVQEFLTDGTRIPVTCVWINDNPVISLKNKDTHGYLAVQLGFGEMKKPTKSQKGLIKGTLLEKGRFAPSFLKEIRLENSAGEGDLPNVGDVLKAVDIFKAGDIVDVTGISKGKGFAGGVKRHHFKGGPKTHGQSDRQRAPGSIGQTTTPGRVYKGKRMAGRMGHENITVKNLQIVEVSDDYILIKGLIPGGRNTICVVKKVGESKKFVPLFKKEVKETEGTNETKGTEKIEIKEDNVVEPKVEKETASNMVAKDGTKVDEEKSIEENKVEEKEVKESKAE